MAYYVKVTQQVCRKLGHGADRNDTADQNKLLWQADIDYVEGETVFDRAATVGGVCLDAWAARAEIEGVDNPAEVYTPEAYRDPEEAAETVPQTDAPSQEQTPAEEQGTAGEQPHQEAAPEQDKVVPNKEGEAV